MKEIRAIIEQISNTASTLKKEKLLRAHARNNVLFALLHMHEDDFTQFYISKLPSERPAVAARPLTGSDNLKKFMHLTTLLSNRTLSGHEALSTVYDFFQGCDEDEVWVFRTILLKEAMNFGSKLINKVLPGFLPEFTLMLADSKQPKLSDIKFPIISQTKLDGFRCVYFPATKTFMGRNGKPIRNENLRTYFKAFIEKNDSHVIDGELYSDTLSFNEIASVLNSENKSLAGIYYCAYDYLKVSEWAQKVCEQPYAVRLNKLGMRINQWKDEGVEHMEMVMSENHHSIEAVESFYKWALDQGFEGLMLKDPNGAYNWKRVTVKSGIMMKLKPHDEYDGQIIGFEEGTGQHAGMLGSFIVEVEGIKNAVKVGSGFSEEQRTTYWKNPYPYVRQWIKLKGFEVTEGNESLRFPIFLSFRDSKD